MLDVMCCDFVHCYVGLCKSSDVSDRGCMSVMRSMHCAPRCFVSRYLADVFLAHATFVISRCTGLILHGYPPTFVGVSAP